MTYKRREVEMEMEKVFELVGQCVASYVDFHHRMSGKKQGVEREREM